MIQTNRITPMMGKKTLVFLCEKSIYKTLEQMAERQFVRPETLVDVIVKQFQPKYEDIIYFLKGGYNLSITDRLVNAIREKEAKEFTPMQLDDKTIEKLGNAKRYYGMNKSMVLKHIIIQYHKENYAEV